MTTLTLQTHIKNLFMVGPIYAKRLKKLNIETVEDLLCHYPHRWEDWRLISKIALLQVGEKVTVQGKILECRNIYTKHGKKIQRAIVADDSGQIEIIWFNQPFIPKALKPGLIVSLSGKVDFFNYKKAFISPEYEIIKTQSYNTIHTGRLVPIYPETYGVSSKWLRSRITPLIENLLPKISDWLPEAIKTKENFIDLKTSLKQIHFPENQEKIEQAKNRLKFDELFLIQLASELRKKDWQKNKVAHSLLVDQEKVLQFIANLPFQLTQAQKKAIKQILIDLSSKTPMNRLLEGDVGSGKTVVATIAMYVCFLNGLKSILMAPTEILANQHFRTVKTLLEPFNVKVELLTGSRKPKKLDNWNILIGTHALLYNKEDWDNVGFVVIDEQHRFGVEQRAQLIQKGKVPHVLTMTATPIPRTIALTLYADLDLSVLDEMPKGRKVIKTWVVPPIKRAAAYEWIKKQIKQEKTQAFIVCPLIEESDKESMKDIRAAKAEFARLSKQVFPDLKLGLLHGRMKAKEKEKVMKEFKNHKLDILVSTPVVEVGIDVPKATIMMVEGADRFGLAQLHQLRGRVGRSGKQSYCLLFTEYEAPRAKARGTFSSFVEQNPSEAEGRHSSTVLQPWSSAKEDKNRQIIRRLRALEKENSGFKLAEIDFKLRGPGEIYGTTQHGFADLKIASFTDIGLIEKTKQYSKLIIEKIDHFPLLKRKVGQFTIKLVEPN